jgi:hypothetical protein
MSINLRKSSDKWVANVSIGSAFIQEIGDTPTEAKRKLVTAVQKLVRTSVKEVDRRQQEIDALQKWVQNAERRVHCSDNADNGASWRIYGDISGEFEIVASVTDSQLRVYSYMAAGIPVSVPEDTLALVNEAFRRIVNKHPDTTAASKVNSPVKTFDVFLLDGKWEE